MLFLVLIGEALLVTSIASVFGAILYLNMLTWFIKSEPIPPIVILGYILGLMVHIYQTIAVYNIVNDSRLSFGEVSLGKLIKLLTYEFFVYKMFHLNQGMKNFNLKLENGIQYHNTLF